MMKTKLYIVVLICIVLLGSSTITGLNIPLLQENNEVNTETMSLSINFLSPSIKNCNDYVSIEPKNNMKLLIKEGFPVLPYETQELKFSFGTKIQDIKVKTTGTSFITLEKKIIPAPLVSTLDKRFLLPEIKEEKIYQSNTPFPSDWITYNIGAGLDNKEHMIFLSIHFYPYLYIPAKNELLYAKEIEIEVSYTPPPKKLLDNKIYDLAIITTSDFSGKLQQLVNHKENHGIKTIIQSVEDIYARYTGRDNPEKIKYFIKDSIEKWGIKYILLIGDITMIPARYSQINLTHIMGETYSILTDLYYADIYNLKGDFCTWDTNNNNIFGEANIYKNIDGVDLYPDVYLGRLLCQNTKELDIVMKKIVDYEITTTGQQWFKNMTICAGDTQPFNNDFAFKFIVEESKWAFEGEYTGNIIAESMNNFNINKLYMSSKIPFIGEKESSPLTVKNINQGFNNGAGFIAFIGHGNPHNWATHPPLLGVTSLKEIIWVPPMGYRTYHVTKLDNGKKLPIIVLDACSCADFGDTNDSRLISWEFLKNENGGGIASFAYTADSWSLPGTLSIESGSNYITIHTFKCYTEDCQKGEAYLGSTLVETINDYLTDHDPISVLGASLIVIESWELIGDPSLKIGGYA